MKMKITAFDIFYTSPCMEMVELRVPEVLCQSGEISDLVMDDGVDWFETGWED